MRLGGKWRNEWIGNEWTLKDNEGELKVENFEGEKRRKLAQSYSKKKEQKWMYKLDRKFFFFNLTKQNASECK